MPGFGVPITQRAKASVAKEMHESAMKKMHESAMKMDHAPTKEMHDSAMKDMHSAMKSMHDSALKMAHDSPAMMGHESPAKSYHESAAKMGHAKKSPMMEKMPMTKTKDGKMVPTFAVDGKGAGEQRSALMMKHAKKGALPGVAKMGHKTPAKNIKTAGGRTIGGRK